MSWSRPWSPVLATAAALAAAGGSLPAALAIPAIAVTFGLTPGWIVVRQLAPGARPAYAGLLALVLSPLLVGGPAAALMTFGVAPRAIAIGLAVAIAALALLPARIPEEREEPESAVPWIAGLAWALVVIAFLAGNPSLVSRLAGWFQGAIVLQIAQRGLPVEDPFFAGVRLLYFWGYHVRAALWLAIAPELSVWAPLLSPQVAGALGTMFGVALLAQRLGATARGQAAAVVLAVFGSNPLGWLWLAGRVATGSVRGGDEVRQLLERGVLPVLHAMNPGALDAALAFFGDRYLSPTPFALGTAAFLAFTLCLLDALERPRARTWVLLGLLQAASLFLHGVVGWANALMAAGWGLWTLARTRHPWERHLRLALAGLAVSAVAALLVLLPYLGATATGQRMSVGWGLTAAALRTWLLVGGIYVVAGTLWLARRAAAPGPARELWGFTIALTLAALLVGLPPVNHGKLFSLLFLLLAAPAALKLLVWFDAARGWRRAALVALLAASTVPTVLLSLWGYASEARQLPLSSGAPLHPAVQRAYAWASEHTPADAVFVDPEEKLGMAVAAGRSALWGGEERGDDWGYDDATLERRHRAVRELATGAVSADTRALLRELGRPVVLVHREFRAAEPPGSHPGPRVTPAPGDWELIYRRDGVALHRWKGGP